MDAEVKDFVDRAIQAERRAVALQFQAASDLMKQAFEARDGAITLLRTEKKDSTGKYFSMVAILISVLMPLVTILVLSALKGRM